MAAEEQRAEAERRNQEAEHDLKKAEAQGWWVYPETGLMWEQRGNHAFTRVVGDQIDRAVGQLLVESVAPLALEVTLSVQQELQARIGEVDKLRKKQVERARYEADLAQRRYLHVDPANRLVADSLEADWNEKLRALTESEEKEHRWIVILNVFLTAASSLPVLASRLGLPVRSSCWAPVLPKRFGRWRATLVSQNSIRVRRS